MSDSVTGSIRDVHLTPHLERVARGEASLDPEFIEAMVDDIQREAVDPWRKWADKAVCFILDAAEPMHAADPEQVKEYANRLVTEYLALREGKTDA